VAGTAARLALLHRLLRRNRLWTAILAVVPVSATPGVTAAHVAIEVEHAFYLRCTRRNVRECLVGVRKLGVHTAISGKWGKCYWQPRPAERMVVEVALRLLAQNAECFRPPPPPTVRADETA
jgi:hypothetical protein